MGQSLYYSAGRDEPLSGVERGAIEVLVAEFGVEDQIEQYADGAGANWESFRWAEGSAGTVFQGSVRLPDLTLRMMFDGIGHWGRLLGRIRSEVLPAAAWEVHVEGDAVPWLAEHGRFWNATWDTFDFEAYDD